MILWLGYVLTQLRNMLIILYLSKNNIFQIKQQLAHNSNLKIVFFVKHIVSLPKKSN